MAINISDFPVMKGCCPTCPFGKDKNSPDRDSEIANTVRDRCLEASQICHHPRLKGKRETHLCRGARDFQLNVLHGAGFLESATDAAWDKKGNASVTQYTLTGSENQMHCIKSAVETQARLEMGQFGAITDAFMMRLHDQDWELLCQKVRELERIVSNMPRKQPEKIGTHGELSWDIYQVVRHRLSWDAAIREGIIKEGASRDWSKMMMVCYDEPLHRHEEPLMKIEKVKNADKK